MTEFDLAMRRRVVISSTVGNALEWFDFIVYGLLASTVGKLFFPAHDPFNAQLLAYGSFAVSYVARPLGGVAFGTYADRHGRKKAMVVMISMMAVATGMIGLLPTYAQIGLLAPLGILLARLIQGFSAGGEFGSATAMLIEFAPPGKRGIYGTWQTVAQSVAFCLGAGVTWLMSHSLTPDQFERWGWRVPFLLGMLIGPVGFYLRSQVDESPEFKAFRDSRGDAPDSPLWNVLRFYPRQLAVAFCLTACATAITYVGSVFLPGFAVNDLGMKLEDTQLGLVFVSAGSALMCLFSAALSDRIGRRRVLLPIYLVYVPCFYALLSRLVAEPSLPRLWQMQSLGLLLGLMAGPLPALMTEIFPVSVRSTGASLMYNLAVVVFGGMAPLLNTELIHLTGSKLAPAGYILIAVLVGTLGLLLHRERGLHDGNTVGFTPRVD